MIGEKKCKVYDNELNLLQADIIQKHIEIAEYFIHKINNLKNFLRIPHHWGESM